MYRQLLEAGKRRVKVATPGEADTESRFPPARPFGLVPGGGGQPGRLGGVQAILPKLAPAYYG